MYVREIEGEETTLGVSGALWRDALVMYDRTDGSYWSQIDGRAIHGPAKGARLREVPSVMTTWGEWRTLHPDTLVLKPGVNSRNGSPYAGYFRDDARMGIFGTENPDDRLPGKTLVMGIEHGDDAAAVTVGAVEEHGAVHVEVGDLRAVVVPLGDGGRAWRAGVEDRALTFEAAGAGRMRDVDTGSVWDVATGRAVEGPMQGRRLEAVETRRVYWFVWASFHPGTAVTAPD